MSETNPVIIDGGLYLKALECDNKAQFEVAEIYYNRGWFKESFSWYKESADNGYFDAQFQVGKMYFGGIGIERNYTLAAKYYEMFEENGGDEMADDSDEDEDFDNSDYEGLSDVDE